MSKDPIYPVLFLDNTCPYCGTKTLSLINKFGRKSRDGEEHIYPIYSLYCNNCERDFAIRWIKENEESRRPVAVSHQDITDFTDILKRNIEENSK